MAILISGWINRNAGWQSSGLVKWSLRRAPLENDRIVKVG